MFEKKLRKQGSRLFQGIIILISVFCLAGCTGYIDGMLNPKGIIALEERKLFFDTLALMLIVVLPVIVMSITFAYHYRASNRLRDYKPNWAHSYLLESLWWGIPCVIIVILAVLTWKKTVELDPYKPLVADNEPTLLIQAIALPWKWLFIYPQQHIATVNYLEIPVGQQVEFWLTTDNVAMSAFFIPQLGSQIYAMSGMRTRLYLMANQAGTFLGMNTLFNGDGFAGMQFKVKAVPQNQMQDWFNEVKAAPQKYDDALYQKLITPSVSDAPLYISNVDSNLFQNTVNMYMMSTGRNHPREANQILRNATSVLESATKKE